MSTLSLTMRRILQSASAALIFGATAASADMMLPEGATQSSGTLHLGADFAAAPNQFINADGENDGLNVDMCGEIAVRLGAEIEWTNLAFPGLVPGLQAGRFDGICTSIFINPKRKEIMHMVAYVQWGEGLMVRTDDSLVVECSPMIGDAASYNACFDQLSGRTVAVAAAGTTNQHLIAESERMEAAGHEGIDIRAFDTNADAIQALASGQADGAYLNDPQAHFYLSRNPGYVMPFAAAYPNTLAIATLKNNLALAEAVQAALESMKSDGTYDEIVNKWGVAGVSEFALNP
ncbi:MAG: transporter substrate-binding domain-containing protein [Albidovulum sp.]|nr:transporter substrate-binding domain-containing protein [Albidovulum sp.]